MAGLRKVFKKLKNINPYSKFAIKLGFAFMLFFYITAIVAKLYTPYAADYFYAASVYAGSLEAAPACLAVGVCTGLLGDLMLSSGKEGKDDTDDC